MKKITPLDRQSLFDIAMQTSGSIEASYAIAQKNNVSITDAFIHKEEIMTVPVFDRLILDRLKTNGINPATEVTDKDLGNIDIRGIGFMEVETNFFVR